MRNNWNHFLLCHLTKLQLSYILCHFLRRRFAILLLPRLIFVYRTQLYKQGKLHFIGKTSQFVQYLYKQLDFQFQNVLRLVCIKFTIKCKLPGSTDLQDFQHNQICLLISGNTYKLKMGGLQLGYHNGNEQQNQWFLFWKFADLFGPIAKLRIHY